MIRIPASITHLLLDIEGTTCPVSFVAEVLFPYARGRLGAFLQEHGKDPEIASWVEAIEQHWASNTHSGAVALRRLHRTEASGASASRAEAVVPYLQWLIDHDIKLTALKDLQGRIWQAGYASGELVAPLYADVPEALMRWQAEGLVLGVYSSGSVPAQQLLYGHSQAGDLCPLFSHWFDTRSGAKQEASSYRAIAAAMAVPAQQVLFISDSLGEITAAAAAGMAVLFSDREGNPSRDSGLFERISNYSQLTVNHGRS
jgi:enolase-phosphatase E1